MADLKISALNALSGADLVAADVVAVVDDSASETKKLTVSDLIANGTTLISDATIPSAKILFAAGAIDTAELAASSVETAKINDSAVTAAKLADNSSVTLVSSLPASGDFVGQVAIDTTDDHLYVWDGSSWDSVKAAGSINVVNGSTSGIVNITTSTSGDTVTISTTLDDTSAAKQFLAGPTGAGGTVGYRAIASGDLPTATTSAKGAVAVNGNGLTMSNDEIQIDNSVTAETTEHHLVQYDANGLITAGRVIASSDLPEATSSAKGAVVPGSGLDAAAGGTLNHSNSTTPGTFTKVTVDAQGHVTSAVTLVASDIPELDADKITTGTFPTARLSDDAVTAAKLADQSVTKFGGAGATDNVVTFPDGDYKGQFFFDEKNEDLYVYTGESFLPITVISGNLVNAGTYNANTNLLTSVTTAGSAAGFTNGAALPNPAAGNLNYYVVVDTSGTGSGNAPAVALAPPDMLISLGVAGTTFQLIDVSNAIAGQTAANISVVATGNIAATDVQAALQELDSEKLAKAGGTMTGNLELGAGIVIVFEGATANDYETTLTVTDPTADRTITLPNETGTVVTTGSSGVVTSTMITDGTIVNADISASAEIAVSKLANGTARQLLQTDTAGTGVEFTSNVDVPGTLDVTGAATFDSTAAVTGALTVTGVINADGKVKFPAGTAAAPSFYNGTDTDTGLYFSAANEISVATGGTQRVVVNSSGNLGLSVASPAHNLDVYLTGRLNQLGQGGHGLLVGPGSNAGGFTYKSTGDIEISTSQTTKDIVFSDAVGGNERMRLTGDTGRLGIGTSAPIFTTDILSGTANTGANANNPSQLSVTGPNKSLTAGGATVFINSNSDLAADTGGSIALTGRNTTSSTNSIVYSVIKGAKENATSTNVNGYFAIAVQNHSAGALVERLRIDSSGNVGIGTASPTNTLHVYSTSNTSARFESSTSASYIRFKDPNGDAFLGNVGNDIAFYTSSSLTERMRIDSSGRVGIGVTPPNYGTGRVSLDLHSSGATVTHLALTNSTTGSGGASNGFNIIQNGLNTLMYLRESGYMSFSTANTERMRIDSSGDITVGPIDISSSTGYGARVDMAANAATISAQCQQTASSFTLLYEGYKGTDRNFYVNAAGAAYFQGSVGIGTTSPSSYNAAADNLVIYDSGNAGITIRSGTSSDGAIYFNDTDDANQRGIIRYVHANDALAFHTSVGEALRIDSSGNVGIGTTSPGLVSGMTKYLTLAATGSGEAVGFELAGNRTGGNQTSSRISFVNNTSEIAKINCSYQGSTTTGSLEFHTSGSQRAVINSSGNLGVGTTAPAAKFSVSNGGASGIELQPEINSNTNRLTNYNRSTSSYNNFRLDAAQHEFLISGSEKARIDTSGRLLVGATSAFDGGSSTLLQVLSTGGARIALGRNDTTTAANDSIGRIRWYGNDSDGNYDECARIEVIADADHASDSKPSALTFHTTAASAESSSERLRIDSSGNLNFRQESASSPYPEQKLKWSNDSTTTSGFYISQDTGRNGRVWHEQGLEILFGTSNTEQMRLDVNGRLLVGTSTTIGEPRVDVVGNSASATGEGILQVRRGSSATSVDTALGVLNFGDTTSGGFRRAQIIASSDGAGGSGDLPTRLVFTTCADGASTPTERLRIYSGGGCVVHASSGSNVIRAKTPDSAGTSTRVFFAEHSASTITSSGTISFNVYSNGNVQNTNNSYGAISDVKLKENIVDANSQWDDIKDLRVRNYNFIEGQTHTQIGVVAQEVETVSPGLVTESPDLDAEGNDLGTTTKSVNYSVLYMKAVKALQEAMDRIETLEAKVAALEAE